MKCPRCGVWNQAYLPKCTHCGAPLEGNDSHKQAAWEDAMHKKKPSLRVEQYEPGEDSLAAQPRRQEAYDPDALDRAELTDEMEALRRRREEGSRRIAQMKDQAERVRRSVKEAEIIRPMPEPGDPSATYAGDGAAIRRRQQAAEAHYTAEADGQGDEGWDAAPDETPYGTFGDPAYEQPLTYDDDDEDAPVYYDGYTPDSGDQGALTDKEYMPRRIQTRADREEARESFNPEHRRKNRAVRILLRVALVLVLCAAFGVGGVLFARQFISRQGMQLREENETRVELTASTADGHPAHTLTFYGKENATIYLRETQTAYVIADGKATVTIPDYMWYDTESSTFATAAETDTLDVTVTPYIRYSQEGDQFALEPVTFTVDVPLSPIRLLKPATVRAEVGVSIYEVSINVEPGSTVVIDGTDVSTLIRSETGNVSKNVQVLPVGENTISISVKSKYCRENKMEVTLVRERQDITLELAATVISEWNYEAITEEQYNSADAETRSAMNIPSISGKTLPGAQISVEFPHWGLEQNYETGEFSFHPMFTKLGDNDVIIRASYEGMTDSVITHTVYYMPNADIYTRKAWDLDAQYSDLINYIGMRKGTIYVGTGTIERIISTSPQMAIMNISTSASSVEKKVMLENSSKTTWEEGVSYRVYGEAYGLYDTMPRLTVRYTYLIEK